MNAERERAQTPEELPRLFVRRANAGDVEGLVSLYESGAVLAVRGLLAGHEARGTEAIRQVYERILADKPTFAEGEHLPVLRSGNLAMTSTRLVGGGATAEVARRQPDGTWLWIIDQPFVVE